MILFYGAIALLVVAIAVAVLRTQGPMRVSRELVPSDGGLILDVGSLPGVTPEPSPAP